jgi:hypothetical protein
MTEFRTITDYPRYEASSEGDIRNKETGRFLLGTPNTWGYIQVGLTHEKLATRKLILKHIIIAKMFLGDKPPGMQTNHRNGNKKDNRLLNLEYVTPKENSQHAYKTGLSKGCSGEKNGRAILTNGQVEELRKLKGFFTYKELGVVFGIAESTVSNIMTGFHYARE